MGYIKIEQKATFRYHTRLIDISFTCYKGYSCWNVFICIRYNDVAEMYMNILDAFSESLSIEFIELPGLRHIKIFK